MIPWASLRPQPTQHHHQFSRFCADDCRVSLYFTMGRPFPPQNCLFLWGILNPSNTWFPQPTWVLNLNDNSICSAVFAGLTSVTDGQTDHATRSVTSMYEVLQCSLTTTTVITSGQSNFTKRPHYCRTLTVQSYSPGGAPSNRPFTVGSGPGDKGSHKVTGNSFDRPESITQKARRSVQLLLHGSRLWQTDRSTDHATSVTIGDA